MKQPGKIRRGRGRYTSFFWSGLTEMLRRDFTPKKGRRAWPLWPLPGPASQWSNVKEFSTVVGTFEKNELELLLLS